MTCIHTHIVQEKLLRHKILLQEYPCRYIILPFVLSSVCNYLLNGIITEVVTYYFENCP